MGGRLGDSRILCPPCFCILLTLSLCPFVCMCVHGGEAYLACYHFLNDLCFHPMMDCIALIDINFPEPGKKKKKKEEALLAGRACWYKGNSIKQQLRYSRDSVVSSVGDFTRTSLPPLPFTRSLTRSLSLSEV